MNSILVLKVSLLGLFALSVLSCGGNLKSNYPSGAVPCREETTKIVEVINPATGKKWMDRNLGASKVAEWVDDPEAYGELYQWGRFPDGHQCRRSDQGIRKATSELPNVSNYWHGTYIMVGWNPNDWLSPQNDELWQGISGLNNPCPKSFRIPTIYEWEAERKSWTEVNSEGAFESPLKLTAAGHRIPITGDLGNVGRDGEYWSSKVDKANAKNLYFNDLYSEIQSSYRASGISVRCIKD